MPIYQAPPGFGPSMHGCYEKRQIIKVNGESVEHITKFDPRTGGYEQIRVPLPPKPEILQPKPPPPLPKEKPGFWAKRLNQAKRNLNYLSNKITGFFKPKPKFPWDEYEALLVSDPPPKKNPVKQIVDGVFNFVVLPVAAVMYGTAQLLAKGISKLSEPVQHAIYAVMAAACGATVLLGGILASDTIKNIHLEFPEDSIYNGPRYSYSAPSSNEESSKAEVKPEETPAKKPAVKKAPRNPEQPMDEDMFLYHNSLGTYQQPYYVSLYMDTQIGTQLVFLEFKYYQKEHDGKPQSKEDDPKGENRCMITGKYYFDGKNIFVDIDEYTKCGHFDNIDGEIVFELLNGDSADVNETQVKYVGKSFHLLETGTVLNREVR